MGVDGRLPRYEGMRVSAPAPDEHLLALLERYLAGGASPAEAAAVRAWLANDPGHATLLEDLRLIRRIAAERAPHSSVDAAWARAVAVLFPRARRWLTWPALAAAAIVVAVVGYRVLRPAPQWREFATAPAHRAVVRLRDGTRVFLAPQSRLRYRDGYGAGHRDVQLDGAAHFEVVHAPHPFRVHTRGMTVEDLGTAFAVRSYPDQAATEVAVTQGRVALWGTTSAPRDAPALVLAVGDLARVDAGAGPTVRHGVDVERYVAWTKGVLAFDGTPLGDVVSWLERWYDVHIELGDDALAARRLTATFHDEPIALVLKRVALTLDLRVERGASSFHLLRKGG